MKKCPVCDTVITGRSDKKYCSAYCKSAQQYEKRKQEEDEYYKIDRQLKTNRKILKAYNKSGLSTVRKEKLLAEGFNPKFFTHYWKNTKGQVYLFCYEYGFLLLKENQKEKYILVKWQKYMEV
ncbi:hypothetical protein [Aquimarina algiphila]|uniref:DUF2116 family Zn-ribbon domain-containing protein n=1 Tax=Aquimarina algiphila TaxID=2047982 RepID=A0A554VLH8_9FLAO|nr:hypothetical protein [Aquimarina algiphila]TSE09002.1 hypothetical protein FOF46_09990 [Aquimarina algiphila]